MTYTVDYRDGGAKHTSVEIEAENRSAVFAELKRRGITAISVNEGKVKRGGRSRQARPSRGGAWGHAPSRGAVKGIVAALIIIAGAVGVWWWLAGGPRSRAAEDASSQVPPKRQDVASPKAQVPKQVADVQERVPPAKVPETPKKPEPKTYRDAWGILRYEGGARVPNQRPTAAPVSVWANKPKIFKHSAEESIADVLKMEIGQPVIGDFKYGEHFAKSFKESLDEPVEILDTDDEETIALKKDVKATKEELKARVEAGEDVVKIMNDAMDEYRRLGQYRHELQVLRAQYMNDGEEHTEQDYRDFTDAANQMLKEKGLPPLALPRSLKRGLGK